MINRRLDKINRKKNTVTSVMYIIIVDNKLPSDTIQYITIILGEILNMNPYHFEYHLDSSNNIIYVDRNWSLFALLNNAPNLTKEYILNTSIYNYISDEETKHIYNVLFSEVRTNETEKSFPFRCDSPKIRRFMEMSINNMPFKKIIIKTKIIKEEHREEVSLLDSNLDRSGEFIRMCSFCKKIYISKNKWVEVEEAIRLFSLFSSNNLPQITHTYCNQCRSELLRHIR